MFVFLTHNRDGLRMGVVFEMLDMAELRGLDSCWLPPAQFASHAFLQTALGLEAASK